MLFSSAHDLEADALYITLTEGVVARTIDLDSGTLVDVDADGRALGLEVIHPHRVWPVEDFIRRFDIPAAESRALRLYASGFSTPTPSFRRLRKITSGSGRLARLRPVSV
jgi:uncharacterized protein YuzE